jgi:4-hydroxy-2-oxoheptanedioate aldolase
VPEPLSRLARVWKDGGTALGIFVFTRIDPVVIEAIADVGLDFLCVDLQHGMLEYRDMVAVFTALAKGDTTPIVRVPANDAAPIGKVLDAGALGVIVPMVNTAADARAAVSACRYATTGGARSYGPIRSRVIYGNDYAETVDDRVLCIPQIETAEAVANADEIMSVPGVAAVYVGPTDLSLTLGLPPTLDNPGTFDEALRDVVAAAKRHHVVPGVHASTALAAKRQASGFRMITIANDLAMFVGAFTSEIGTAREAMAKE